MKILWLACGLAAVAIFAASQNVGYTQDPNWAPPPEAAAKANPLADKADALGGGRKLFNRNCVECHGKNGSGVAHNAADLQLPVVQQQSDGTLFWKITNGNPRHGMPSFSGLPELQRWQLVLYLRTLKAAAP